MRKLRGFTLIELLIVVAIIAILAAIAIPNFLEAQVRAKVSRVRSDLRSISAAVEAYCIDTNQYPAQRAGQYSINATLPAASADNSNARDRSTFACLELCQVAGAHFLILTTPVSYITSIPADPFADTKRTNFGYANAVDKGWIMWSYGPDTDETYKSQIDYEFEDTGQPESQMINLEKFWAEQTIYNPFITNPLPGLLFFDGRSTQNPTALTYDPTNGSVSDGDLWRFAGE